MTDHQMHGNSFCEFGLVSTYQSFSAAFDPKVHIFENSLPKMLAPLHCHSHLGTKTADLYLYSSEA